MGGTSVPGAKHDWPCILGFATVHWAMWLLTPSAPTWKECVLLVTMAET